MSKVSGGIKITALMDGSTINGFLRVDNMPLIQRYTKGSTNFIPDFTKEAENARPVVVPIIRDAADGRLLKPNTITFKYNGTDLAFGSDGLCTTPNFVGFFKKINDYNIGVGMPTMPAIRVMKNLVPISGYDNDRISVTGTVEVDGYSLPFAEMDTAVVIQETTGSQHYAMIFFENNQSEINDDNAQVTAKIAVYKDGAKQSDLSGYTFQWVKELTTGDVNLGTGQTQVLTKNDVNFRLILRCDVKKANSLLDSARCVVRDSSETYVVLFDVEGINGQEIRKGQTAVIKPYAIKRGFPDAPITGKTYSFYLRDNAGNAFTKSGKTNPFSATQCDISYSDVVSAKYGLHITAETDIQ